MLLESARASALKPAVEFFESDSGSSTLSDLEEEVAQLVYKVVDEDEAIVRTITVTETEYQKAKRAATLYSALFQAKYGNMVLGPGPNSVYTASIVFPQIARSSGYQLTYVAISVKMICLTVICFALQCILASALWKAAVYRPTQSGMPHMCTYGQDNGDASSPKGPLGIPLAPDRSNLETDYNMVIIRNTLAEVMRRVNVTNPFVGPVDFGTESATCRFACVAAFFVSIIFEINSMWGTLKFLLYSPTLRSYNQWHAEQWISFAEPDPSTRKLRSLAGKTDIDSVTFKMAGMPLRWKLLWAYPVLIGKISVICTVAYVGFRFLVNTGGVTNMILNSLALFFIVELDQLTFNTFARDVTRDIMQRLEPYRIPVTAEEVEAYVRRNTETERHYSPWDLFKRFMKITRMMTSLALMIYCSFLLYLYAHCIREELPFSSRALFHSSPYFSESFNVAWEVFLGGWHSKNTTKRSWLHAGGNQTICAPYGNGPEIVGCGMPTPWHSH